MTNLQDFLHQRLQAGGFTTEDTLASVLPLARQVAAAHRAGLIAPLAGINDLHVEGVRIWFEEARRLPPTLQIDKVRTLEKPASQSVEVVGEIQVTANADSGEETMVNLLIGKRGDAIVRPVYLPGYVSWEHEIGHHDPLTDIFSLGMILASLACGLDFNDPEDLARFVSQRRNLFDLNPHLHPVLAKAVVQMTELNRQRRPQDMAALVHTLENYRDQAVDLEFDLARASGWKNADSRGKRELILTRLQQRLFELTRRNRLLHFRPTMHTVNLTQASVPLSFDFKNIRPEQILTCDPPFQQALAAGKTISLNKYLRFEEALYLPGVLDEIRNEARRDQTEYGIAQLRLVLCFLRWNNLKEKPPERYDSPLVLLPVRLTKTKGVRDVHSLEPLASEAEINPVVRHYLKQLYGIDLPERIELVDGALDKLHEFLIAKIQSSEPAVTVEKIDRPRIQLIQASAQRRLDQYRRRARLSGRGVRSFGELDYSYDRNNYHPLGLRLFQTRIKPSTTHLRTLIEETPRPRSFMQPATEEAAVEARPPDETSPPVDKQRQLYSLAEAETNPYHWEFDLCNVTLGNFRYQKMSLVRDYATLLQNGAGHSGFERIFSLAPRPTETDRPAPLPLEESYAIMPSDPTQASAVALARTGKDFIIQGPPGTGKSQTITNLIADYVMRGKRILFVCEKRAAIDVVYHRLRQAGLHQLCCLIHDSQADKKEFILELKETYEGLLETQNKKEKADQQRQRLLTSLKQDITPLHYFDQAMRSTPPQTRMPLRRLLHRAVELGNCLPELAPKDKEKLPPYALWDEHREHLERLAANVASGGVYPRRSSRRDEPGGLLPRLGAGLLTPPGSIPQMGDSGRGQETRAQRGFALSNHPLRLLNRRLAGIERPLEFISQSLDKARKILAALESRLGDTGQVLGEIDTLDKAAVLVNYAVSIQFLAERKQLSLLRTGSDLAKKLASFKRSCQSKTKDLDKAREATRFWRQKLPAEEVKIAIAQALALESSLLRFIKPSYWRLRGLLNRGYHFSAHAIKPSWSQILAALDREYQAQEALAEVEGEARTLFGFDGDFMAFANKIAELGESVSRLPAPIQAIHASLRDGKDGDRVIVQLAGLRPTLDELERELTALLEDYRDLPIDNLRAELTRIENSLDDLPDFLPCLSELAALPPPLAAVCRWWPQPIDRLEAALARYTLDDLFRADRLLARHTGEVRASHVDRLDQGCDRLHEVNAAAVQESIRRRFLENIKISGLPHAQLGEEQKEFKTQYNRGRRELEHEFGKTMRFKSIRDIVAGDSGVVLQDLKPVWLMSPPSVSDTLPLDTNQFDVVIFDEASQVTLEEAVPSLFRSRQVIVVGDPMQLPPTNFFAAKQEHLAAQGHAPATIRSYARDLLGVASRIEMTPEGGAARPAIEAAVDRWLLEDPGKSAAVRKRMVNVSESWLRFSGLFVEKKPRRMAAEQVDQFTRYMSNERGFSPATISSRLKTIDAFLSWMEPGKAGLAEVLLADVDRYLESKGREGWKRRTVATNGQTLRSFFHYAEHQGWCQPGIAAGIELPRIYGMENVPLGPSWQQVQNLVATTDAGSRRDRRDRAALLLFAVYGLRCSEVRQLRLDDIDWDREIVTVRRSKCRKTQEFPLTREVGDAIIQYIREVRPKCKHREIFITLKAPWRPVSHVGFYDGIRERIDALGIDLAHRGPHSLRHACATHLMTQGLSLKQIGDHLGHSSSESTRIYAKVDMAGLREVAELDFGGLR